MAIAHIHDKLIKKCKAGSNTAQFEIYKLYYKGMYNVSLRIVQDSQEAEDVMQEAFLAAFSKLDMWSQEVTFGSWLKKIVVNKSLDYIKKRKMQFANIDDKDIVEEDNVAEYDESMTLKVVEIKKAIQKLDEKYRIVALMFLFEGYTHNEIADILEISPEASRVRFKRAKEKIAKSPGLTDTRHSIIMN